MQHARHLQAAAPERRLRPRPMRLPIRTKLWILLALASSLPLAAGAMASLPFLTSRLEERAVQQVALKAAAVVRHLQGSLEAAREDTLLLARLPQVRRFLETAGAAPRDREDLEEAMLAFGASKPVYDQVRVLDLSGRERGRVNRRAAGLSLVPEADLQDKSDRYYFKDSTALDHGEVYVSPLDWNVEEGRLERPLKATVRYCATVVGHEGDPVGLAVLNLRGEELLAALDPGGLPRATVQLIGKANTILAERGSGGRLVVNQEALSGTYPAPSAAEGGPTLRRAEAPSWAVLRGEVVVDVPVTSSQAARSRPGWVVRIRMPEDVVFAPVRGILKGGVVALGIILLLSIALGSWISQRVAQPLVDLTQDSRRLAAGDYKVRTVVESGDELEELARALRVTAVELGRQRELEERLLRSESLASVGQFAAEVAHEVGNPLAAMKATLQALQEEDGTDVSNDPRIERVVREIDRLGDILRRVRQSARVREPEPSECDVLRAATDVSAALGARAAAKGVRIKVESHGPCPKVRADLPQLQQILFNLLFNAIDAASAGTHARLDLESDAAGLRVTVTDAGEGIPEEDRARVFEPFFTTKSEGSGLGLWVTSQLVKANGGSIAIECPREGGTRVTVQFPPASSRVDRGPKSEAP